MLVNVCMFVFAFVCACVCFLWHANGGSPTVGPQRWVPTVGPNGGSPTVGPNGGSPGGLEPSELISAFKMHCVALQKCFGSELNARERRFSRLPMQVRDLYNRLQTCTDEQQRGNVKRLAWERKKAWIDSHRLDIIRNRVRRGGVFCTSKKLHTIRYISEGALKHAGIEGANLVARDFSNKWQCSNFK